MYLCNVEIKEVKSKQMDKQELKKQILHRLMELKAEDQMNRFVFTELANENYKDLRMDEVLDFANDIQKEVERLEQLLKELD